VYIKIIKYSASTIQNTITEKAHHLLNQNYSLGVTSPKLLTKKFTPMVSIIKATLDDYPLIQNMARFYVYDRTAYMGWECPENGLFECIDFKHYFENPDEKAFLIKVYDEIAGFVLLDKTHLLEPVDWNMGEFFILAKFQGKGIASTVARKIFKEHHGKWSIAVMQENIKAVKFWRKIISDASHGNYREVFKASDELTNPKNPNPYAMNEFTFDINNRINNAKNDISIRLSQASDIQSMVEMSYQKRRLYEKAQPQFWKYTGEEGDNSQRIWFKELLEDKNYLMFTATSRCKPKSGKAAQENNDSLTALDLSDNEKVKSSGDEKVLGFIIGKLITAPEVYNPSGLTLMVDDFCVNCESLWRSVGAELIKSVRTSAKAKGASQILVVCGAHDYPKRNFLKEQNLSIASEWFVGGILE
jgi:predicted acetyltransferase